MKPGRMSLRQWAGWTGLGIVLLLAAALAIWRGDILRAGLDTQVPFQTYKPPPAPDYARPTAWALWDERGADSGPASIFFVHSTTFDGGREWNGPIGDRAADAWLRRVLLPSVETCCASEIGQCRGPRQHGRNLNSADWSGSEKHTIIG